MATENHPLKQSSRELLALLLSPGSTRTPLLNVDEIKEILESSEPASADEKDGRATTLSPHSNDTALDRK
jgi:hypothetical protein